MFNNGPDLPANMDMTEMRIVSTVWIGNHLSDAFSYPNLKAREK